MRSFIQQFDVQSWPTLTGPVVVLARQKNSRRQSVVTSISFLIKAFYGDRRSVNRDRSFVFRMRDGPPNGTGPPDGVKPPEIFSSGFSPPKILSQSMEWLAEKKTLKKF